MAGVTPGFVANQVADSCNNTRPPWGNVQMQWVSPPNNPTATSLSVPYNSTNVQLQLNYLTYRCYTQPPGAPSILTGSFEVLNVAQPTNGLVGFIGDMQYVAPNQTGYRVAGPGGIQLFTVPGPFTKDTILRLDVGTKGTVTNNGAPNFQCSVVSSEPQLQTNAAHNFDPVPGFCKADLSTFFFNITISPAAPQVYGYKEDLNSARPSLNVGALAAPLTPFADNKIIAQSTAGVVTTVAGNPFQFANCNAGCSNGATGDSTLAPGTYTFNQADSGTPDGAASYIGYAICVTGPTCNEAWLMNPAHMRTSPVTISNGQIYEMRFIYKSVPVAVLSCGGLHSSVSNAEDGVGFTIAPQMTYFSTAFFPDRSRGDIMQVTVVATTKGGTAVPPALDVPYVSNSTSLQANPVLNEILAFGTYTITYTVSGPDVTGGSKSCPDTIDVIRSPYFKVYNGDIFTGGAFQHSGACPAVSSLSSPGRLLGNFYSATGVGAGSQIAAIAMANVTGVSSNDLRATATSPAELTFANVNLPGGGGGMFGGFSKFDTSGAPGYCASDYFNDTQFTAGDPRRTTSKAGSLDVYSGALADGQQVVSTPGGGQLQLRAKGSGINKRFTLFVDGDVYIKDNIVYAPATWTSVNTIPYLAIIVRGNILIDSSVTQLTGLFIAQPSYDAADVMKPDSGRIYTCTKPGSGVTKTNAVKFCDTQLNVRGALIGQRIILRRTIGSLKGASLSEPKTSPNVAEIVNYTPEFFVGRPVFKTSPAKADSIKSLPPTL